MQPRARSGFEVAIICALPLEADAVRELFGECYDDDGDQYGKQSGDPNSYTTGMMGKHHVVLAYMLGMGKVSAASVAASLKISFNRIRLALVVGICGAIPFTQKGVEIVLGDVIISNAVIEYDFGGQYSDGFQRKSGLKDTLGRPDQEIRSILNKLETRRSREQLRKKLLQYLDHFQKQPEIMAGYPGAKQDRLFDALYRYMHHQHPSFRYCLCAEAKSYSHPICEEALNSDCESLGCKGNLIVRQQRDLSTPKPLVHIGMIASASAVVKSAEHRDQIAKEENVIAFEMEGAGVWDNLPCVIIKVVCDYADSHKNKEWQNYAAATGASAAKAFLDFWIPYIPTEEARKKGA
ncbi:nucleoside phosphorylase domain-containing protein [Delphinella strobiligena]|nr:nucleoside phosphorylase domain-containing protein [Delphinella strobiligena]